MTTSAAAAVLDPGQSQPPPNMMSCKRVNPRFDLSETGTLLWVQPSLKLLRYLQAARLHYQETAQWLLGLAQRLAHQMPLKLPVSLEWMERQLTAQGALVGPACSRCASTAGLSQMQFRSEPAAVLKACCVPGLQCCPQVASCVLKAQQQNAQDAKSRIAPAALAVICTSSGCCCQAVVGWALQVGSVPAEALK